MNRCLLLLPCLLFHFYPLQAQTPYHPMLREGRTWDIFAVPGEMSICPYARAEAYFLEGDTVFNGLEYKKLYFQIIRSNPPVPFCTGFYLDTTEQYLFGYYFREDTLTRRVYAYTTANGGEEELLFDFSLQAGDTLHYVSQFYVVTEVLDFVLDNGEHRKGLRFGQWPDDNLYVEGIGYLYGAFNAVFQPFEGWNKTTCVRDGDVLLYSDEDLGGVGCVLATSGAQSPEMGLTAFYPNPFDETLTLKMTAEHPSFVFALFDTRGVQVFRTEIPESTPVQNLQLPQLPKGMYFWALNGVTGGKLAKR